MDASAQIERPSYSMMSARTISMMLFGANAAKKIEFALGCSHSQARRIATHGHVPQSLREGFWHAVERKAESLLIEVEAARDLARAESIRLRDDRLSTAATAAVAAGGSETAHSVLKG